MTADKEAPGGALRGRVYRLVLRYPGIHLRGVEQQLGISSALSSYHLHELEKRGWLRSYETEGYTRWFPGPKAHAAPMTRKERRILGILRGRTELHIALLLLDRASLTHGDIVEAVGLAKSTVSYHLDKLEEAGLVRRTHDQVELADPPLVEALLLRYEPTPDLLQGFSRLWGDFYATGGTKP